MKHITPYKNTTLTVALSALVATTGFFGAASAADKEPKDATLAATEKSERADAKKKVGDIVAVADGAGKFTTLCAAVKAAGLVETLQGEGPFTVFALQDEAFAKLPKGTLEDLLKAENRRSSRPSSPTTSCLATIAPT